MVSKKKRNKIGYCYKDFCRTLSDEERVNYQERIKPLVEIIYSSEEDTEIIARVREFDSANGTDLLSEAIRLTLYCLACHRVDCTC
ncbi:hypothetical protein ACFL6N_07045 [Thermodesulfobacteriota bacterium]